MTIWPSATTTGDSRGLGCFGNAFSRDKWSDLPVTPNAARMPSYSGLRMSAFLTLRQRLRKCGEFTLSALSTKTGTETVDRIGLAERVQLQTQKMCAQTTNVFPHNWIPTLSLFLGGRRNILRVPTYGAQDLTTRHRACLRGDLS